VEKQFKSSFFFAQQEFCARSTGQNKQTNKQIKEQKKTKKKTPLHSTRMVRGLVCPVPVPPL
jgi:hypothetical protein